MNRMPVYVAGLMLALSVGACGEKSGGGSADGTEALRVCERVDKAILEGRYDDLEDLVSLELLDELRQKHSKLRGQSRGQALRTIYSSWQKNIARRYADRHPLASAKLAETREQEGFTVYTFDVAAKDGSTVRAPFVKEGGSLKYCDDLIEFIAGARK